MTITSDHGAPVVAADALRRRIVILSPILLVRLGFVLARITAVTWGAWSWLPVIIYYWRVLIVKTYLERCLAWNN